MTAKLELSLLGTVAITLNGEGVSGQVPAKSQALLCYLAVTGRPYSREKLAGLLWGDKPEAGARANLRKSLSNLRQLFGNALIITRQTVAFNRDSDYWLDMEAFESALAEDDTASEKLQPLGEAVDLYRGKFLEGFSVRQALGFEEWVLSERERLRQSLAIGKEIGDWFITEMSINALSYVARSLGAYAEAVKLCHEGIALCRAVSDRRGEVFLVNHLAWVANAKGDYAEAKQWLQEAFVFHEETNDKTLLAESLAQLGTAAYLEGAYAEAKRRYLESIEISKETGERWRIGPAVIGAPASERGQARDLQAIVDVVLRNSH